MKTNQMKSNSNKKKNVINIFAISLSSDLPASKQIPSYTVYKNNPASIKGQMEHVRAQ